MRSNAKPNADKWVISFMPSHSNAKLKDGPNPASERARSGSAATAHHAQKTTIAPSSPAHHARRRGAGTAAEGGPNAMLRLMRGLIARNSGLVLLTATPMQVHPIEVYDLLSLLGLPTEWTAQAFLRFFEEVFDDAPSYEKFDRLAAMFQSVEETYGLTAPRSVTLPAPRGVNWKQRTVRPR
jgi:hypothetical protein